MPQYKFAVVICLLVLFAAPEQKSLRDKVRERGSLTRLTIAEWAFTSLEEVASRSDAILGGTATGNKSQLSRDEKQIDTTHTFRVSRVLKGDAFAVAGGDISFISDVGEVQLQEGKFAAQMEGFPNPLFTPGHTYIVFLSRGSTELRPSLIFRIANGRAATIGRYPIRDKYRDVEEAELIGDIQVALSSVADRPVALDQVLDMLRGRIPQERIAELLKARGSGFDLTLDAEAQLRNAGASNNLLTLIAQNRK